MKFKAPSHKSLNTFSAKGAIGGPAEGRAKDPNCGKSAPKGKQIHAHDAEKADEGNKMMPASGAFTAPKM
jgi:hypothetical protein